MVTTLNIDDLIAWIFICSGIVLNGLLLWLHVMTKKHARDLQKRVKDKPAQNIKDVDAMIENALNAEQ